MYKGKYLRKDIPNGIDFTKSESTVVDTTKITRIVALATCALTSFMAVFCFIYCAVLVPKTIVSAEGVQLDNDKYVLVKETEEKVEPPHVHHFKSTEVSPSCTTGGYTYYECECGNKFKTNKVPALGHDMGEWVVEKEATYTEEGYKVRRCTRCGLAEKEIIPVKEAPSVKYDESYSTVSEDRFFGWSEADYMYLLRTIVGECQNCSREEQLATGSVILNRLNCKKYWPYYNTIRDVVKAPGQYSCWGTYLVDREPTETNKEVALYLLQNGPTIPANCIFQAQFVQGDGVYQLFDSGTYICYKD